MRENQELPLLNLPATQRITLPDLDPAKEAPMPAEKKKQGKKSRLKATDTRSSLLGRNTPRTNARQLPTRQMNNRGGR